MNIYDIKAAKNNQEFNFLKKANVNSVSIGYKKVQGKDTPQLCIVVGVSKKLPESQLSKRDFVAQCLDGIPVDIIEMGNIKALSIDPTKKYRPIIPGVSISHPNVTAGTGSCIAFRDSIPVLLSNCHVLANSGNAEIGDEAWAPGCYSDDTKVLTKRGFVNFDNVSLDDEVLTLNVASNDLEWQKPTKLHNYPYEGDMIYFKGQMYDILVTPNHNMVVRKWGENKWFIMSAEEIFNGQLKEREETEKKVKEMVNMGMGRKRIARALNRAQSWAQGAINRAKRNEKLKIGLKHNHLEIAKTGEWNCTHIKSVNLLGQKIEIDEFLKFIGFWIAEGSIYIKKGGYGIFIRNFDISLLEEMKKILEGWGLKVGINKKHGNLWTYSKELFNYLKENCYSKKYEEIGKKERKSPYKKVPDFLKELTPEKLKILLKWLFLGDGSFEKGRLRKYHTTSDKLASDVAEIAIKCGYAASISEKEPEGYSRLLGYTVGLSSRNITPKIKIKPKKIKYSGRVHCLTVPNHTMFVMRNGKISVCGNSYDGGSSADVFGHLLDFVKINMGLNPINPPSCNVMGTISKIINYLAELLNRKHRMLVINSQAVFNEVDAAIASIEVEYNKEIPEIGVPVSIKEPELGMEVQKFGRTTSYTTGKVEQMHATVNVGYDAGQMAIFQEQIILGPMSAGGDSGSSILDMNKNLVALLFAGSEQVTIASPMSKVFSLLNLSL